MIIDHQRNDDGIAEAGTPDLHDLTSGHWSCDTFSFGQANAVPE